VFERLTEASRAVLVRAQDEAAAAGHTWVGTEHLLLGLLVGPAAGTAAVLQAAGVTLDGARAHVGERLGDGPLRAGDAAALRAIGIDLGQVRQAAEDAFGPGALSVLRPGPGCRRRRRRGCRGPAQPGHTARSAPFTPRAKKALELSLRESLRLGHAFIGPEHVLLGLIREGQGPAVQVLAAGGTPLDDIRTAAEAALGGAA